VGLKPSYQVTANGSDVTQAVLARLMELRVTDGGGDDTDLAEIKLSDGAPSLALPATGAQVEIWLGYDGTNTRMGIYLIDSVNRKGPPPEMTIRGHSAPYLDAQGFGAIQSKRSQSYDGLTIAQLVNTIANRQGMSPFVSASLSGVSLPHIDQTNESDISLLNRLAVNYDATVKPAGGKLLFLDKAQSLDIAGDVIPPISLTPAQVTEWDFNTEDRSKFTSAVASWHNNDTGLDVDVTAGSGDPVFRLRHLYPDANTAGLAATAAQDSFTRGAGTLTLRLPGNTSLMAYGILKLSGFADGVNGNWLMTSVEHSVTPAGYQCTVQAETPATDA